MMEHGAELPDEPDPRPASPPPGLPAPATEPEVFPSPPDPIETPIDPDDAIETLRAEHVLIERVLTAFVAWSRTLQNLGANERAELERFTRFFDRFLDRCHHAKEEDILFRALQQADARARALVHASFVEQEEQRRLLEPLQELTCRQRAGAAACGTLQGSVAEFVASVRAHMAAEECVLFPAARARIPRDAMVPVRNAFAAFEAGAAAEHERLRELGRSLIETYAPKVTHLHRGARSSD